MILLNIRDAGFAGALYAVNPHASDIEGIRCVPSVAALPEAPDLAVVAVPAAGVLDVAQECGKRGARSLVVITSGLTPAQESSLLEASRRAGMRLVGPDCFGVAVPGIGLDATFARHHPSPGKTGLVSQSGGVGVALLEHLSRLGIGISSFASVGGMLDISGNDMLMWWEADNTTELAVLYLESFGNPRRFARTARRVSSKVPVLTVHAGRSVPGQRAAASHTAAAAAPLIARQALFEQAGIIATTSLGELLDAAALIASQPVPAGSRRLRSSPTAAVRACWLPTRAWKPAWPLPGRAAKTRSRLRDVLPAGSRCRRPGRHHHGRQRGGVPPGPAHRRQRGRRGRRDRASDPHRLRRPDSRAHRRAAAGPGRGGGAGPARGGPAAALATPARPCPRTPTRKPAARALARAARYGSWRSRPAGTVPEIGDLRVADARAIVGSFLARMPGGGWLSAGEADDLLRCYGIPMVEFRRAEDTDAAIDAAAGLGGHVVIKADVPGLLHKTDAGAVELDLRGADEVRGAMRRLQDKFAGRLSGVLVEPMITGGTETIVGVVQEPVFGPVVVFGLGGVATEALGDRVARLAPLTGADADDLIRSIRAAPLLLGQRGQPTADIDALRDTCCGYRGLPTSCRRSPSLTSTP